MRGGIPDLVEDHEEEDQRPGEALAEDPALEERPGAGRDLAVHQAEDLYLVVGRPEVRQAGGRDLIAPSMSS
ncbi:hypothetical protein ATCC90586_004131 [Pythium insidiosum]|nr:hypothetical protein ATCC90586_004131 [Pythium insidiosum]